MNKSISAGDFLTNSDIYTYIEINNTIGKYTTNHNNQLKCLTKGTCNGMCA